MKGGDKNYEVNTKNMHKKIDKEKQAKKQMV